MSSAVRSLKAVGFRLLFFKAVGPGVYYAPTVIVFSSRFVVVPTQLNFHCGQSKAGQSHNNGVHELVMNSREPTMAVELSRDTHKIAVHKCQVGDVDRDTRIKNQMNQFQFTHGMC